ncbi:MAG: hypothetical protein HY736_15485 [Verrucomicrobia bacterium]|nr:hypothetical protein [Verrucomicrobiota bacterium]
MPDLFSLGDPGDSALLVTLPAGSYSVVAAANASDAPDGVELVEVFDAGSGG